MKHPFRKIILVLKLALIPFLPLFAIDADAQLTAKANHDHITVDSFYHGGTVSVSGISDPGADLVIKIASGDLHQSLRKKGKVGGLLWMTVGELDVEHVPNFYEIFSTKKLDEMISRDEMDKYGIGFPALRQHAVLNVATEEEKSKWFDEFVRFKSDSNLYAINSGNITLSEKDGMQNYYILTRWPYQAPPGNYTVTVYAVKNGKVMETATSNVNVEQVGTVRALATMAKNNGALYGILSILAALGAGFGVGLIFRKSEGAH
ncbi:MAG TPA: TIGR02186 family protein [Dissulfurispiraceae bacterium]|nr:TIGR02186 family protein [Dissulfurispiraceae bacterium]